VAPRKLQTPHPYNKIYLIQPASRAGTRSVATLTEAQLARKRANDREAQRSIRQRTKDRIEGLEQRIRELTEEQNDGRSLEDVERRNSELEEELRRLRESLPNAESMMIPNFPPPMCKCSSCATHGAIKATFMLPRPTSVFWRLLHCVLILELIVWGNSS
jgi:hypothetical protein